MKRVATILALLLLPRAADAQEFWASGIAASGTNRVSLSGRVQATNGFWGGFQLGARLGRFRIHGTGTRGRLTRSDPSNLLDRDIGEMTATLDYAILGWLSGQAGYTARAFASATGRQRWNILSVGVNARQTLGTPMLEAFAQLSYLPVANIEQQEGPDLAVAAATGITLRPGTIPLLVSASYAIERFEFPGSVRSEQFERLTLTVGILVARGNGAWSWGR